MSAVSGRMRAGCERIPDQDDLDRDVHGQLLLEAKEIIREISSRFDGAEHFTAPIERMDSIDEVMGFVMPFVPAKLRLKSFANTSQISDFLD